MSEEPSSALAPALASLPVLPLKNTVLFPSLFLPLAVGRENSVAAVEAAAGTEEKSIIVVAQRDATDDRMVAEALFPIGTRAVIKKMNRDDESLEVLVQGIERVRLIAFGQADPYLQVTYEPLPTPNDDSTEVEAMQRAVLEAAGKVVELAQPPQGPVSIQQLLANTPDPLRLAYLLGSMLSLDVAKEQALLEADTKLEALNLIHGYLTHETQVLELRKHIATQAQSEMTREQRHYVLRQQLKAIQDELGEKSPESADADALRDRLAEADLPDEVRKEADRELTRLERLPAQAPDYQVTRTYLELIAELPWRKSSIDLLDLDRTREILDEDHYGLEDVKERILEHLAVLKLNPKAKAPILCFVGPPGVGKTSLGQSIARSLGRKFERLSLGGMHDESELRGHRRTYIGAMPGRIIQAIRRAGVNNPMLLLDEVDKLGHDFRGDPAAALLEVLDPAQNHTFRDNYLDLAFDLSKVFFVATANSLDPLPRPLLDRLELIRLTGYSEDEKLQIAKRYLVPRQRSEVGLTPEQADLPDETLIKLIRGYTREAGCRQLERVIGQVLRKRALKVARGELISAPLSPDDVLEMLGPDSYTPEGARTDVPPGVATGMAWTEAGGEVLYIEASLLPDSHELRLTGQLGSVMQESARAAQTYVQSHYAELGIDREKLKESGVHVHVPAGAVPKDGPSAGTAMVVALASLYTGVPVRSDTAMTGEITLSGLVLPIGGVKEKILGARRAGIRRVILPKANGKDLRDLPAAVRDTTEVILAERIGDVLKAALVSGRLEMRLFRSLRHRNFRLFFFGQTLSLIGTWTQNTSMLWLVDRLTGSALMQGVVGSLAALPALLLPPFAGVVADGVDRRRMLIVTQSIAMLQAVALVILVATGQVQLWQIILCNMLLSAVNAFDMPARQAFLGDMLDDREDLANAIAMNSSMVNGARLFAPAIAALAITHVGEQGGFAVNALSFLAVIIALSSMRIPRRFRVRVKTPMLAGLREGWAYVAAPGPLRATLLVLGTVSLCGLPYHQLLPRFTHAIAGNSVGTYAALTTSVGMGALTGALYIMWAGMWGITTRIAVAPLIAGACLAAVSYCTSVAVACMLLFGAGFGFLLLLNSANTLLQFLAVAEKRGRVMGYYAIAFTGMAPIGNLLVPSIAEGLGIPPALRISGAACALAGIAYAWSLRHHGEEIRQRLSDEPILISEPPPPPSAE